MEAQLELIPLTKHIPQWLAEHFNNANAGSYRDKQLFYSEIKYPVLEKYADKTGWDKQVVEKKCNTCNNGIHWSGNICWNCTNGIYQVNTFYLKRYVLNGVLYHIPQFDKPQEPITNTINGIISHKEITAENALKSFLILCAVYNKQLLRDLAVRYAKEKYQSSFIQALLKPKPTFDDLPF